MGQWRLAAVVGAIIILLLGTIASSVTAKVISQPTKCLGRATLRIHYSVKNETDHHPPTASCRSTLMFIGVGTAMSVPDYDQLAISIAEKVPDAVVVIVNHVRSFIKLNPVTLNAQPFASALNRITTRLLQPPLNKSSRRIGSPISSNWLPRSSFLPSDVRLCPSSSQTPLRILVGGHSASGGAAFYALDRDLYNFKVAGYLALDPFPIRAEAITSPTLLQVPTLAWGFSVTTCQVTVSQSAVAAYQYGQLGRSVLYQVQNDNPNDSCRLSHCLFADRGCLVCRNGCNATSNQDAIADVGWSVHLWVTALQSSDKEPFSPEAFDTTNLRLDRKLYRIYPFNATTTRGRSAIAHYDAPVGHHAVSRTIEIIHE